MANLDAVKMEIDRDRRILHISATERIDIRLPEDLDAMCIMVQSVLKENFGDNRGYMVVDMSKIVVDPNLARIYARHMSEIVGHCVCSNGVARYGYDITRLTVRQSYREIPGEDDPSFFATKEEAFEYIESLIERQTEAKEV